MPRLVATSTFSSVLILAITARPSYLAARSSTMGAIMRQGPHQGAQKSTITGTGAFSTSSSNRDVDRACRRQVCRGCSSLWGSFHDRFCRRDGSIHFVLFLAKQRLDNVVHFTPQFSALSARAIKLVFPPARPALTIRQSRVIMVLATTYPIGVLAMDHDNKEIPACQIATIRCQTGG